MVSKYDGSTGYCSDCACYAPLTGVFHECGNRFKTHPTRLKYKKVKRI